MARLLNNNKIKRVHSMALRVEEQHCFSLSTVFSSALQDLPSVIGLSSKWVPQAIVERTNFDKQSILRK